MTELKTLKDLFYIKGIRMMGTSEDFEKILKAEAIKWVKKCPPLNTTKAWIMLFFNLTESDLK